MKKVDPKRLLKSNTDPKQRIKRRQVSQKELSKLEDCQKVLNDTQIRTQDLKIHKWDRHLTFRIKELKNLSIWGYPLVLASQKWPQIKHRDKKDIMLWTWDKRANLTNIIRWVKIVTVLIFWNQRELSYKAPFKYNSSNSKMHHSRQTDLPIRDQTMQQRNHMTSSEDRQVLQIIVSLLG